MTRPLSKSALVAALEREPGSRVSLGRLQQLMRSTPPPVPRRASLSAPTSRRPLDREHPKIRALSLGLRQTWLGRQPDELEKALQRRWDQLVDAGEV